MLLSKPLKLVASVGDYTMFIGRAFASARDLEHFRK